MKEIIRIKYADSWIPENWVFEEGDKEKQISIILSVFLIRQGKRNILVDTGCESLPGLKMENYESVIVNLEKQGVQAGDVTDVIITHAHHDHIECVKCFSNATIYIQSEEYEKGKKYIPANFCVRLFEEECLIDEGIRVVKIGGHTKGSCVVEVTNKDKQYVLCGDECYKFYNLKHRVRTGSSFCKKNSEEFIEKYSNVKYVCLLCHDMQGEE